MSTTLESRITRLERQNKALRTTLIVCAIGLVACAGGITSNFALVNTETLVVQKVDDQPVITMSSDGTITFHDAAEPVVLDAQTLAKLLAAAP